MSERLQNEVCVPPGRCPRPPVVSIILKVFDIAGLMMRHARPAIPVLGSQTLGLGRAPCGYFKIDCQVAAEPGPSNLTR